MKVKFRSINGREDSFFLGMGHASKATLRDDEGNPYLGLLFRDGELLIYQLELFSVSREEDHDNKKKLREEWNSL